MSFAGKVILITGASSGIGADAARHLAKLGGQIALVGRNEKRLNDVVNKIKNAGSPQPLSIVADVSKDAERIINGTVKHFGKLNILINNAGMYSKNSIDTIDLNEYDVVMKTNVRSVIEITKLAVPHLEKSKGNILNVSSSAGLRVKPNYLAYSISKAAVNHITKSAALDLASKGIRVNAINPVVIRTPIFEKGGVVTAETSDAFFDSFKKLYPVGRVGEVSDTSAAIEFLTSDAASFFTGTLLPVDGGALTAGQ